MQRNIIRHKKRQIIQLLIVSSLLYLLGRQSLQVENGQFERQYSRIYTTVVFALAIVLLLILMIIIARKRTEFCSKMEQ